MNFLSTLYSEKFFPLILDVALDWPGIRSLRKEQLKNCKGKILEIGVGTGLNFSCYPASVKKVVTVDPHLHASHKALARADKKNIQIEHHLISGEKLPFGDASFDTVVSTFTLCSIPDPQAALGEIKRVLKKNGRFYFLEHGLSPHKWISILQQKLTPLHAAFTCGCQLNRDMEKLLEECFLCGSIKKFYYKNYSPLLGYFYMGEGRIK